MMTIHNNLYSMLYACFYNDDVSGNLKYFLTAKTTNFTYFHISTSIISGGSRGKSGHGPPSSLAIDFGPLQQRNKHEILENILNCPPPSQMSILMWPYP